MEKPWVAFGKGEFWAFSSIAALIEKFARLTLSVAQIHGINVRIKA
jgi:hypothetical protein